ncbi:MAG: transcriptional repressor [Butyrivibrio sp.]|nr:transcriptional repressor [Butyrivibrio sp.]
MSCKIHAGSYDDLIEKNWPAGVKKTRQRADIFKVLYAADLPMSAAEIYSALNKGGNETYAFSTVYRNLLAFEKAGIVSKTVLVTEDNAVYELKQNAHRHYAVCIVCHTKFPIQACPVNEITKDLEKDLPDFKVTGHQLEIYGYCKSCASQM